MKNSINHEELKNCLHFRAEEKIGGLANERNHTKIHVVTTSVLIAKEDFYYFTCYWDYRRPSNTVSNKTTVKTKAIDRFAEVSKFLMSLYDKPELVV